MSEALVIGVVVFTLAMFVGLEIITKVPPTLHTPLMSGANAVSGVTIIGALIVTGGENTTLGNVLGTLAIIFATINVVGGFMVTDRMLRMFRRRDEGGKGR
jgi:NAD(P) transhydrogenase subunit alpha